MNYQRTITNLMPGLLVGLCFLCSTADAAEPYLKFVQGLRTRQYYDTAIQYLQNLDSRSDVPAEVKVVIAFEKAITLVEGSQYVQNPETQAEQLDQAQAFLEKFLKDSPRHELAATANTELARIMIGKAQVLIWRSKSPSNAENRLKFQQEARQLVQSARSIFQKANDTYKAEWESYGVFIPEDEVQKRAARAKAEGLYLRAQLDLATCTYEEAQTFDEGSKEFVEKLKTASLEFEELHNKYRSQYAGLFARTMQGKCFEEQDDIRKAIGIYDELLGHPGQSEGLKRLQHQVRHFRLICLNHESRKDYQLVILEASEWIKLNRSHARTPTGMGIRWELAQAQENLALQRTTEESEKTRLLRQALENAREINKYTGPYKDVSNSMIQRVLVALDREPGDPEDFDTAFGMANTMLEQIGELREKLKAAKSKDEKDKLEGELQALLSETERLYRLALQLAEADTDGSQINAARYRLAYMFYLQRESYETAVVGEYLALRAEQSDPAMALDGAYLAMAGYSQAYNDASESAKDNLLALMVNVCEKIATTWPDSDRATDARMEMGRIYRRGDQPLEAAKWYSQVPKTVPQYADSQIEAGQAYWNAYLTALVAEQSTASQDDLKTWQDKAVEHLQNGINKKQEGTPASAATPQEITRAKVSLAQIEIMRGKEAEAIKWLTADPHSVVKAINPPDGKPRPKEDFQVQSTTFASFAYQQLLRAYIGTKQLDQAEQARAALEKVAGESGGEALTAVYVELGRELQNELERLKKQGDQKRINDVRSGFESFLSKLFERKDGQTYGSLIWIAETYFGLAEGSEGDPQKVNQYYTSASQTYEEIIKRAERDTKFLDESRQLGVKLRLVNCKRQSGDFSTGESLLKDILRATPRALDAQIEAAALYHAWGLSGENNYFDLAIKGQSFADGTVIWGWGNIAKRLQMLIDSGQGTEDYAEKNREARFKLAESRFQYAEKSTDLNLSEEQLKRAKFEILTYTSITPDLPTTTWWKKFDTVYQDVLRNLGEAVVPLEKPDLALIAGAASKSNYDSGETTEVAAVEKPASAATKQAEPESNVLSYVLMGVLLLGGLGVAGYMVLGSGSGKNKRSATDMINTESKPFSMPVAASTPPKKRPVATAARTGTQPSATADNSQPRRTRPVTPGSAEPEPRKRRPEGAKPEGSSDAPQPKMRRKPPEQN